MGSLLTLQQPCPPLPQGLCTCCSLCREGSLPPLPVSGLLSDQHHPPQHLQLACREVGTPVSPTIPSSVPLPGLPEITLCLWRLVSCLTPLPKDVSAPGAELSSPLNPQSLSQCLALSKSVFSFGSLLVYICIPLCEFSHTRRSLQPPPTKGAENNPNAPAWSLELAICSKTLAPPLSPCHPTLLPVPVASPSSQCHVHRDTQHVALESGFSHSAESI